MTSTNKNSLLPSSATTLERNLSQARQIQLEVELRKLWDPKTCPEKWLPFLAWQFSVDRWDENWTTETKRQIIANSYLTHKTKGTVSAIKKAIEPFGYLISIKEWFETGGAVGTFSLNIGVFDSGITNEMYAELTRIIDDVRVYSRHLIELKLSIASKGSLAIKTKSNDGEYITVYPHGYNYKDEKITTKGTEFLHIASHIIDYLEVKPCLKPITL